MAVLVQTGSVGRAALALLGREFEGRPFHEGQTVEESFDSRPHQAAVPLRDHAVETEVQRSVEED